MAEACDVGWKASGTSGVVAASGAGAVAAGIRMLEQNGNAAVATILALAVTDFGWFAFGGEVPLIYWDNRMKRTVVLADQGRAPRSEAAIAWYMKHGIPKGGDMRTAAVPGAPDLCIAALRLLGTLSFEQCAQPILELLSAGREWEPALVRTVERMIDAKQKCTGSREEKLQAASDRFYRGDIARELEIWYIKGGGFLRGNDLAAHTTNVETAVTATYRDLTVCKCNTWTQGTMLLQALLSDPYTALRRPLIDMAAANHAPRPGDPRSMKALRDGGMLSKNDD